MVLGQLGVYLLAAQRGEDRNLGGEKDGGDGVRVTWSPPPVAHPSTPVPGGVAFAPPSDGHVSLSPLSSLSRSLALSPSLHPKDSCLGGEEDGGDDVRERSQFQRAEEPA